MLDYKIVSMCLTILLLTGCSVSSGRHALGLPPDIPEKEKINNGVYTGEIESQLGFGEFSVKVPQASDDYIFSHMQMKEEKDGNYGTYVSFGPSLLDYTIYRVFVSPIEETNTFESIKDRFTLFLPPDMSEVYGNAPLEEIFQKNTNFKGHRAFYQVYTQPLPHTANEVILTHAIYLIDYEKYVVVLWAQSSNASFKNAINDENRSEVTNLTWKPQLEFFNSFHLFVPR